MYLLTQGNIYKEIKNPLTQGNYKGTYMLRRKGLK
jgi:hypothetical protein